MMRIMPQDFAILAGARLRLVGIDQQVVRTPVGGALLRHKKVHLSAVGKPPPPRPRSPEAFTSLVIQVAPGIDEAARPGPRPTLARAPASVQS